MGRGGYAGRNRGGGLEPASADDPPQIGDLRLATDVGGLVPPSIDIGQCDHGSGGVLLFDGSVPEEGKAGFAVDECRAVI